VPQHVYINLERPTERRKDVHVIDSNNVMKTMGAMVTSLINILLT